MSTPSSRLLIRSGFEPGTEPPGAALVAQHAAREIQEFLAVLRGWSNSHGTTEWAMEQLGPNERHFLSRARALLDKYDPPVRLELPKHKTRPHQ